MTPSSPDSLPVPGRQGTTGGLSSGVGDRGGVPEPLRDRRLTPLWQTVHRRLETSGGQVVSVAAYLKAPSEDTRAAIDRLLGVRSRGADMRISLDQLDDRLRQRLGWSLLDVVTVLVGPVYDRPGQRIALVEAEAALWDRLFTHPALKRHPDLSGWLVRLRTTGSWHRLDDPESRLMQTLDVLGQLPQLARRGLSQLANRVLGDAHGLDAATPTGRLVTAALAHRKGLTGPLRSAQRRQLWADQGIIFDETSSTVLTLGLRPDPLGPLTEAAHRWADGATPLTIPLAAVQVERWQVSPGTTIWTCENPSVLAAAVGTSATVICLEGRPSLAAVLLLRGLVNSGALVRYHGDFGSGGISIANEVISNMGATPWRFGVQDHQQALRRAADTATELRPLRGAVPDACWDPELAPSIRLAGVEVEEESVIDLLLSDIDQGEQM
ncbi:MAG: TIGR02679 family protein [Actinomycetota bacterium]|nr:TIGR02679 family protein [Actinomycetota bacterium]